MNLPFYKPAQERNSPLAGICLSVLLCSVLLVVLCKCGSPAKVQQPDDAPKPQKPAEAIKSFRLPAGFRIELVASEPLIREPTGVCWDEKGRLYVSELHGYNLEGQLEIEEMNKSGVLDTVVRRVQAAEKYKEAALAGTYGTVKRLSDTNGDGIMDKVEVLADRLPPAYGLCAAREGLIVAGQTEIVYLADKNNDGKAEIVDTLFTGFQGGALERGLNAPQWGPDGWIYVGRGWNGGLITGPYLKEPVQLPGSNFRIRPDGTAIEPVTGSTHTIGHAFTEDGYSFFTNTWKHALYAIPIPWPYLKRNPDASIASLEADASDFSTVFPIAPVHPWKLARSNQPGWKQYYDRYGLAESVASGYFTSCCSPIIYQDNTFPAGFSGNLFVCEPAQSLVHRSLVERDGTGLKVKRATEEKDKEFLGSTDSWFRPVSLAQAPDGSLFITDMYREIIEDYSAVPRFMQQRYGLKNGTQHGRIWRVSPDNAPPLAAMEKVDLSAADLEKELDSPHLWHRQTAERLLYEREGNRSPVLARRRPKLSELSPATPAAFFIRTLQSQDTLLKRDIPLARQLAGMRKEITDERMLLQLTLSLGYSQDAEVFSALTEVARIHAAIRWMPDAIMSGVHERSAAMLIALLHKPGATGNYLIEPLSASIAARGNKDEISKVMQALPEAPAQLQASVLKGFNTTMKVVALSQEAKTVLNRLLEAKDLSLQGQALSLAGKLQLGDSKVLNAMRDKAAKDAANNALSTEQRLAAITLLADAPDELAGPSLVAAWKKATPPVQPAILDALISRGKRLAVLLEAINEGVIPVTALSDLQRRQVLERADSHVRPQMEKAFAAIIDTNKEQIYERYAKALLAGRDAAHGEVLFKQMCASCHKVNQVGVTVGPDLKNAYANSEQTLLRSILFPNEKIASGYEIYVVTTGNGEKYSGVLVSESAGSVVLRQAGGKEQSFLKKDIKEFSSSLSSLMPEYGKALSPKDCADIIEWLRTSLAGKQ